MRWLDALLPVLSGDIGASSVARVIAVTPTVSCGCRSQRAF